MTDEKQIRFIVFRKTSSFWVFACFSCRHFFQSIFVTARPGQKERIGAFGRSILRLRPKPELRLTTAAWASSCTAAPIMRPGKFNSALRHR
jgi:hypothetical protein